MSIQKYLVCEELYKEEQQLLFSLRTFSFPTKSNKKYMFDDLSCRACLDPQFEESEVHFCNSCVAFDAERGAENLQFEDVFGPLEKQIAFVRRFKFIARKWNWMLELN